MFIIFFLFQSNSVLIFSLVNLLPKPKEFLLSLNTTIPKKKKIEEKVQSKFWRLGSTKDFFRGQFLTFDFTSRCSFCYGLLVERNGETLCLKSLIFFLVVVKGEDFSLVFSVECDVSSSWSLISSFNISIYFLMSFL